MARIQKPPPGKLVVSIIYSSMDALADSLKALERKFGRVEFETMDIETADSELYKEEMGENLSRRFLAFEKLVARDSLPEIKSACNKIEPMFSDRVGDYVFRTVNIDPGILTHDNLIMVSHREFNCSLYLKDGVFAELALIFSQTGFKRLSWTKPDFYDPEAIEFFQRVRHSLEANYQGKRAAV